MPYDKTKTSYCLIWLCSYSQKNRKNNFEIQQQVPKTFAMKIKKEATENQLVWAGMRFCPYWPARVSQFIFILKHFLRFVYV